MGYAAICVHLPRCRDPRQELVCAACYEYPLVSHFSLKWKKLNILIHMIHVPCLNAEYCEAILYGYKYGLVTSYSITKPPTTNWIDQSQQQATELLLFK